MGAAGWLDGQVAVITGAGAAVAARFAAEGAAVVLAGRRPGPLHEVAAGFGGAGQWPCPPTRRTPRTWPGEVASVVAFLASRQASAVTGAVLTVDCGATAVDLPTIAFDLP